ncbi:hypothetical protein HK105_206999 [Polyrhizophydium stewartii]|uniref:PA14 domain-containing protein n=1 Tax=Polyrhizophydium stewartii TaxID=2732419 RepID=A0ABR4N208_9FUNG
MRWSTLWLAAALGIVHTATAVAVSHGQTPLLLRPDDAAAPAADTPPPPAQADIPAGLPYDWEVLGPFPHGSREVGVDPLSAYGGFEHLRYNESDTYPSELADGGTVSWQRVRTNADGSVGPVRHEGVRWEFNRKSFGWTVLHHATYFRGTFTVDKTGTYLATFNNVLSFKIDNRALVGNVYGYEHASDSAVFLEAGEHWIYVCALMDVRIFGGSTPPQVKFKGSLRYVDVDGPARGVVVFDRDTILPDIVDGSLVTPYGSVTLLNANMAAQSMHWADDGDKSGGGKGDKDRDNGGDDDDDDDDDDDWDWDDDWGWGDDDGDLSAMEPQSPDARRSGRKKGGRKGGKGKGKGRGGDKSGSDDDHGDAKTRTTEGPGWMQILDINAVVDGSVIRTMTRVLDPLKLAPGQVLAVPFEFEPPFDSFPELLSLQVTLLDIDANASFVVTVGEYRLNKRTWGDAYKFTHYGYDSSVQYSVVKPPIKPCVRSAEVGCPVVVGLHGAGVNADSPFWVDSIRRQDYAWVIFPTGRTPWGFDWHGPSLANLESSVDVLQQLLPGVPQTLADSIRPSSRHRVYVGHSNGGQGAWWMLTHFPDTAIAGVPASGYVKIQHYIPYYMHIGYAYADPILRAIFEVSIAENDLDLYIPNASGIPILARTGGDDENVPPLHTRRLVRMANEWNRDPQSVRVSEVANKGHWFEGVLNDRVVQDFLDAQLDPSLNPTLALPPLPEAFTIQTLNPASTGSKGGIRILQLEVPFRLATIRVHRYGNVWVLNTTNVRRFGFTKDERQVGITSWSIDGTDFASPPSAAGPSYLKVGTRWELASDLLWISRERHPSTYGPASLIFTHPFRIVIPSSPSSNRTLYRQLAQHIATSWYLFGLGGTQIVRDVDVLDGVAAKFNLIVLGGPRDNLYTRRRETEGASGLVTFLPSGGFRIHDRAYEQRGAGIVFLAPSPTRTRMGLFVAGTDADGLRRAVWAIPFRTGVEVPDYMVVGDEFGDASTGWTAGDGSPFGGGGTKGVGGVFAAGYWNNTWDFDYRCGYLK